MKIVADHGPGLGCVYGALVGAGLTVMIICMVRLLTSPFNAHGLGALLPIFLVGAYLGAIGAFFDNVRTAAFVGALLLGTPLLVWFVQSDTRQHGVSPGQAQRWCLAGYYGFGRARSAGVDAGVAMTIDVQVQVAGYSRRLGLGVLDKLKECLGSLLEAFDLWQLENPTPQERAEVAGIIRQGDEDIVAGRGRPADQVNDELRQKCNSRSSSFPRPKETSTVFSTDSNRGILVFGGIIPWQ